MIRNALGAGLIGLTVPFSAAIAQEEELVPTPAAYDIDNPTDTNRPVIFDCEEAVTAGQISQRLFARGAGSATQPLPPLNDRRFENYLEAAARTTIVMSLDTTPYLKLYGTNGAQIGYWEASEAGERFQISSGVKDGVINYVYVGDILERHGLESVDEDVDCSEFADFSR